MLVIGDISAKGVRGIEIAQTLRGSFDKLAPVIGPAGVLRVMSRELLRSTGQVAPAAIFGAVLVVTIAQSCGMLTYAAAGVEGGLVFRGRATHEHLRSTGPLLGIEDQARYEERSVAFFPDDVLVAYTDGVTEATGFRDPRSMGTLGLVRSMSRLRPTGAWTIDALWAEIDRYTAGRYQDDATLAILTARSFRYS